MTKLWQKSPMVSLHPTIAAYTAGDDLSNDLILFPYDIQASKAHASMLQRIGILASEECTALLGALDALLTLHQQGGIVITVDDEDGHTVIENYLIEHCGAAGKKIHTGRSRNDQSLVALRLYMKDQLQQIRTALLALAEACLGQAQQHEQVPLPGYTHGQQAMLSSVGHYYGSLTESLLDDIECLDAIAQCIDKNPLGSAASFGVSLPLDRDFTTAQLQFGTVQLNSLYCQSSRGKPESLYLEALKQIMMTLGTFAADLIFFTSQECGFFAVNDALVTGSSIMPQKRNLDGLEILRGNVSVIAGHQTMVQSIAKGLMSGYQRDYQLIKKPLIECTDIVKQSLAVAQLYVEGCTPQPEQIEAKLTKEIFMADIANDLVQEQGIPFRDAYTLAAEQLPDYVPDYDANIAEKVSPGAPGNLGLEVYKKRLAALS